jgi:hypothetical protein
MIETCLEDLERRIDSSTEADLYEQWADFIEGAFDGELFSPARGKAFAPHVEWPQVTVNETLDDFDKMALQQFGMCSQALAAGGGALLCVRANYGTGILPSLFGVEMFVMDDQADTLPTNKPINDPDAIQVLLDRGVPDLRLALGGKVLTMGKRFMDIARRYPAIGRYVHIYHPDLQGPMDVVELLWGSRLFLDIVDMPDRVHALLNLVTETYIRFMQAWQQIVPPSNGQSVHWSMLQKGRVMLRDDSAMNLSPQMFDEFIKPYDQRILDTFGGGAIHFCGRGDHYIESMSHMPGLTAVAMSQPEYNDMEVIFRNTVDRGIKLLGLSRPTADDALAARRPLHSNVHSW